MNLLKQVQLSQKIDRPEIRPGWQVKIHQKIKEAGRERVQIFEGVVIAVHRAPGAESTFVVRREAAGGIGVERIFPLYLPTITKIEVTAKHHVRRAKLYYLRNYKKKLKKINVKNKNKLVKTKNKLAKKVAAETKKSIID